MRAKTLKYNGLSREYVHIIKYDTQYERHNVVHTCELPLILAETATMELLKEMYKDVDFTLIDLVNIEINEVE